MRRIQTEAYTNLGSTPHRVIHFESLAGDWQEDLNYLVIVTSDEEAKKVEELKNVGIDNVGWIVNSYELIDGDVVIPNKSKIGHIVLYRKHDRHHVVQVTNQCNSRCLMCSQPPTLKNDLWMYEEALLVIKHIKEMPGTVGISGGEPLLLGEKIRELIDAIHFRNSTTQVEVLTNGRLLSKINVERQIFSKPLRNVTWLVPLYGHCDFMHDYVVQSNGAFEETIAGLLWLQKHHQQIQLRIVLIKPVLENLQQICSFIGRNLPFVSEVSLMACEPIGYALANQEECSVDLQDWSDSLIEASKILERFRIPVIYMNTPLCSLPKELHKYAHKSISDWKNVYADECIKCQLKEKCCGLFAWHEKGWAPTGIKAF